MINIRLKRSGGLLGKTLQAERHIDMEESDAVHELIKAAPEINPQERDGFHHSISINGGKTYPVDMALLEGDLKNVISSLENELSV
jgi:hypothetical protein